MSDSAQDAKKEIAVHVSSDLDYLYRDIINIHAKPDSVLLEFGNEHLSPPKTATISNRIVVSIQNAYRLQYLLTQTLKKAEERMKEIATQQAASKEMPS